MILFPNGWRNNCERHFARFCKLLAFLIPDKKRMWYCKTWFTSYEVRVASYELLVTSWKLKSTSWNSKVRVQIHDLRVQIHEFKFKSYEFKSTSYEFKSTSHEFKLTSHELKSSIYEFKSTNSRIIWSVKTQVNSLKISCMFLTCHVRVSAWINTL